MSKYKELAQKANEVEGIDTQIEKSAPILAAKLNAIISSQTAKVMEAKAELTEATQQVEKSRGFITTNAQSWLRKLNEAKENRDIAAEELYQAEECLEELEEEAKLFV